MVVLSDLPDECLAMVFQSLGAKDRNRCALVCKRWLAVEGRNRHRLCLAAPAQLLQVASALFKRFDAVSDLSLEWALWMMDSIGDEAASLISARCPNLVRLKLGACRQISYRGMATLAKNCSRLRQLFCVECNFGTKGISAVLAHCPLLENLSVMMLEDATDDIVVPLGGAPSLKSISLSWLNVECFFPLVTGSPNLRVLRLCETFGDFGSLVEELPQLVRGLVRLHLETIIITDRGLSGVSSWPSLEVLHLAYPPEREAWWINRVGGDWISAFACRCPNLLEIVLSGVNPTVANLALIARQCRKLRRLSLGHSATVGDDEISCISSECLALKELYVWDCPLSNRGLLALAWGCPSLVKVKVDDCRAVTDDGVKCLKRMRKCVTIELDKEAVQAEPVDIIDDDEDDQLLCLNEQLRTLNILSGRAEYARLGIFDDWNFRSFSTD